MKIKYFDEFINESKEYKKKKEKEDDDDFVEDILDSEDSSLNEIKDPKQVTSKDVMRITDIVRKSDGNKSKALSLAEQMAKSITDGFKALRRARAAEAERQKEIADIFFQRALELGSMGG